MKKIFTLGFSTGSYDDYSTAEIAAYENRADAEHDLAIFQSIRAETKTEHRLNLYDSENDNSELEYMYDRWPQLKDLKASFEREIDGRKWELISYDSFFDYDFSVYLGELELY